MRYLAAGQVFMQVDQVFLEIIEVLALSPVIREFLKVTEVMSAFLPVDVFQFHLMILKMTAFSIPSIFDVMFTSASTASKPLATLRMFPMP